MRASPTAVTVPPAVPWHSAIVLALGGLCLLFTATTNAQTPEADTVSFNRDIRPILNQQCFKCHGGVKEAGGLNLQFRELALRAGDSGQTAIVPGKPDESAFFQRLITHDASERMPSKEPALPKEQIDLLRRWITQGANWEDHWAYLPPQDLVRSIDAAVAQRLQHEGLSPAPPADIRTLARRLSLDIIGLPPTIEAVDTLEKAFLEKGEAAVAIYVDTLLQSPAYGERWAAPWLDLARYADSKGYESDGPREMWRYRDWVVEALNADMPYAQFLTEQLAGDLLPNATEEQIIATAFHRNTLQNDEGGTDDEEFRTYAVLDRVNTTFDALQGTSISCVQCHGHPYDPILHQEYYQVMAFFNNTADADRTDQSPTRKFYSREDTHKARQLETVVADLEKQIQQVTQQPQRRADFEQWRQQHQPTHAPALGDIHIQSTQGTYALSNAERGQVLLTSSAPARTSLTVQGTIQTKTLDQIGLEVLPDNSLPSQGPGANGNGNFILTGISLTLVANGIETPLPISRARASHEQSGWPVTESLRINTLLQGQGESGWAIQGGIGKRQLAIFHLREPVTVPPGTQLRVQLDCQNERWSHHVLGSFRIITPTSDLAKQESISLPATLARLIQQDPAKWKPAERAEMEKHFFSQVLPELIPAYQKLSQAQRELSLLESCNLPIMQELTGTAARQTHLFHRGNWLDKAELVTPATPKILNPWNTEYPANRLGFAKWLTDGENPLTARVQVNRVWEQLFGMGLVETLEDFGSQGDKPEYQDILDHLALRFQGPLRWSQKALIRQIVLSRTYQQSARTTPELLTRDPANRLLARGARYRLGSEQIRDQALSIGGLLSTKMGGRPVMPYQPPGIWLTPYSGLDWKTSAGEDAHRRALYTFIRRSATYPSMITLDAPNREFCVVRRIRTNTPLQSLDLLNSPVYMGAAEGLAQRMSAHGGSLEDQLAHGIALATLRAARPDEIAVLKKLHATVRGNMTLVANTLLNLDEVLCRN